MPRRPMASADDGLLGVPLSERARRWLAWIGVRRDRGPLGAKDIRARLRKVGAPSWPVLVAIEAKLGGLEGISSDDRPFLLGSACRTFGKRWKLDDEGYALLGYWGPMAWLVRADGHVVEVDEHNVPFFASDTIEKRLEQLAIDGPAAKFGKLDGARGRALARALGLRPLPEPTDSGQRYWATGGSAHVMGEGILVCEQFAPAEYGSRERVWSTWVWAKTEKEVRAALRSVPKR